MSGPVLRVVTYNLHWQRDAVAGLAAVVRELRPDILIAQEAPRRLRWRQHCAELARRFDLLYVEGGLPSVGNLILCDQRVRVHDTWSVQFPLTPGRHLRGGAFARCSVARTPFVVAGSHLSTDPAERPVQAAVLKKTMAEADAPLVLGVDVNESSGGAAWRTLADGLVDTALAVPGAEAATYPAAAPTKRLDAIFVDERFTVRAHEVPATAAAQRASDHLPVLAELTVPVA
jgi:endonuclease/exonuclease/phosphatase family metal-dependent hydrolase